MVHFADDIFCLTAIVAALICLEALAWGRSAHWHLATRCILIATAWLVTFVSSCNSWNSIWCLSNAVFLEGSGVWPHGLSGWLVVARRFARRWIR